MNRLKGGFDCGAAPIAWPNATGSIAAVVALRALAAIVQKHGPHYRIPGSTDMLKLFVGRCTVEVEGKTKQSDVIYEKPMSAPRQAQIC